jgi:hypothetical protein
MLPPTQFAEQCHLIAFDPKRTIAVAQSGRSLPGCLNRSGRRDWIWFISIWK